MAASNRRFHCPGTAGQPCDTSKKCSRLGDLTRHLTMHHDLQPEVAKGISAGVAYQLRKTEGLDGPQLAPVVHTPQQQAAVDAVVGTVGPEFPLLRELAGVNPSLAALVDVTWVGGNTPTAGSLGLTGLKPSEKRSFNRSQAEVGRVNARSLKGTAGVVSPTAAAAPTVAQPQPVAASPAAGETSVSVALASIGAQLLELARTLS